MIHDLYFDLPKQGSVVLAWLVFIKETFWPSRYIEDATTAAAKKPVQNKVTNSHFPAAHYLLTPIKILLFNPAVLPTPLSINYSFGLAFLLLTTFSGIFFRISISRYIRSLLLGNGHWYVDKLVDPRKLPTIWSSSEENCFSQQKNGLLIGIWYAFMLQV